MQSAYRYELLHKRRDQTGVAFGIALPLDFGTKLVPPSVQAHFNDKCDRRIKILGTINNEYVAWGPDDVVGRDGIPQRPLLGVLQIWDGMVS